MCRMTTVATVIEAIEAMITATLTVTLPEVQGYTMMPRTIVAIIAVESRKAIIVVLKEGVGLVI